MGRGEGGGSRARAEACLVDEEHAALCLRHHLVHLILGLPYVAALHVEPAGDLDVVAAEHAHLVQDLRHGLRNGCLARAIS